MKRPEPHLPDPGRPPVGPDWWDRAIDAVMCVVLLGLIAFLIIAAAKS